MLRFHYFAFAVTNMNYKDKHDMLKHAFKLTPVQQRKRRSRNVANVQCIANFLAINLRISLALLRKTKHFFGQSERRRPATPKLYRTFSRTYSLGRAGLDPAYQRAKPVSRACDACLCLQQSRDRGHVAPFRYLPFDQLTYSSS